MHQRIFKGRHILPAFFVLTAVFAVIALALGALPFKTGKDSSASNHSTRLADFPPLILWAWERPEKLDALDTRVVGVAYLARTLYLRGERVVVRPRLQPLKVAPETTLVAVVRIESDRREPARLSTGQRREAVAAINAVAGKPGVRAIQIDFDATASERAFYRELLFDLRREMPETLALSMTALASWCMGDDWLTGLPVDEAVPMLFRMGADEHQVRLHLEAGGGFGSPLCRSSLGVSTDEPFPFKLPRTPRLYVFHPQPWSPSAIQKTFERHAP